MLDFSGTTSLGKYHENYLLNKIKSDYRCHSFNARGVEAQVSPVPFVNPSSGIFKGYLYVAANIMRLSTNLSLQVSSSYREPPPGTLFFNNYVYVQIPSGKIANYESNPLPVS